MEERSVLAGQGQGAGEEPWACVPGTRLCKLESGGKYTPGSGVYTSHGYIYSTLAGIIKLEPGRDSETQVVSVISPRTPSILPKAMDVVTAMVTVVNSRMVQCVIKCVGDSLLARSYRGIIKKEDIRATEKDRVDPYKCYRPGDIILARVMPITEIHWYYLTTAENELGVVIASADGSPQGVNMVPLSWTEMQCPKTLVKEPRKVARVLPENLNDMLLTKEEVQ